MLYDGGKLNEPLVRTFKANVRLPVQIAGDLAAMTNVFTIAQRGLDRLVERYGVDTSPFDIAGGGDAAPGRALHL
ncbi:MAG: hypothetical protein EXR36_11560 [Betaproteobacteria bacterium]|nr:hypothetical protein [Betaproteobacteria bacterium]